MRMRLLAHYSQDQELIDAYIQGKDLYASAASKIFHKTYWECMEHWEDGSANPEGKKIRGITKNIILGIIYGRGAASVAEKTGQTLEEAKQTIEDFYNAYPTVKKWMDESIKMAKEKGYVNTVAGRRRRLPNIQLKPYTIKGKFTEKVSENTILFEKIKLEDNEDALVNYYQYKLDNCSNRFNAKKIIEEAANNDILIEDNNGWIATATRQTVNARVQGGAADLSKKAMIAIYNNKVLKDLGFKMLYVIHDEIAGQCPKENAAQVAELLKSTMIDSAKEICSVPMKVDTYTLKHWYGDDLSDIIKERYDKLRKEKSDEEAFKIIDQENPEVSLDVLKEICDGTFDLTSDKFARN